MANFSSAMTELWVLLYRQKQRKLAVSICWTCSVVSFLPACIVFSGELGKNIIGNLTGHTIVVVAAVVLLPIF